MQQPTPEQIYAHAKRLFIEQVEARGTVKAKTVDGKPCKIPGPYKSTPENQRRAAQILDLRRWAAQRQASIRRES